MIIDCVLPPPPPPPPPTPPLYSPFPTQIRSELTAEREKSRLLQRDANSLRSQLNQLKPDVGMGGAAGKEGLQIVASSPPSGASAAKRTPHGHESASDGRIVGIRIGCIVGAIS